jgi:hypothetical protein
MPAHRAGGFRRPRRGLESHHPARTHDPLDVDAGQVRKQDVEEFNAPSSKITGGVYTIVTPLHRMCARAA